MRRLKKLVVTLSIILCLCGGLFMPSIQPQMVVKAASGGVSGPARVAVFKSKSVTRFYSSYEKVPISIPYNDGNFAGTLYLNSTKKDGKSVKAVFTGTVYRIL